MKGCAFMDNSELFRNELIENLSKTLPQEQVINVLRAFDMTSAAYEIERKPVEIIPLNGIPEVVKHFISSKAIQGCSMGTLKQYRYKLLDFFDAVKKPHNSITTGDIRLYLANFKAARNVSDRYLETVRVTLNSFFSWLVDNEYLIRNPCGKIEAIKFQEKERVPLSAFELETIRFMCDDIREKALIDFLFATGCRVSECAAVRLSDIEWNTRQVIIRHGKGNKMRRVFFNAEAEVSLKAYLQTRSDSSDGLFVSTKAPHNPLQVHALQNIIKKADERSGIKVFPHKLRHTFATFGIRSGMPLPTLQLLMGHSKPETTMIYAKLQASDLQKEHERVYA